MQTPTSDTPASDLRALLTRAFPNHRTSQCDLSLRKLAETIGMTRQALHFNLARNTVSPDMLTRLLEAASGRLRYEDLSPYLSNLKR